MDTDPHGSTIVESSLRDFFGHLLKNAAIHQSLSVSPHALQYVTELLVTFHDADQLFAQQGVRVPVLADMLTESLEADFHRRVTLLRQLGDTSLMVSGYFPEALSRRCLDIGYYRKMGEIAYASLGSMIETTEIYDELSEHFSPLSRLINKVSEQTHKRDHSLSQVMEIYRNTGSEAALEKLKSQGVIPIRKKKTDEGNWR